MTAAGRTGISARRARRRRHNHPVFKPTVEDIAVAAGVSTATVSRVLNKPDSVSQFLRDKVRAEVTRLGYLPSGAARALASNRSHTAGAVIPTLNNAIFATAVAAFEAALTNNGYTMLVTVSSYDHIHEIAHVRRLIERGVDALMLVGLDHHDDVWRLIESSKCPAVAIWGHQDNPPIPCLGFDNAAATCGVVDHLVGLGHRRVGMVAGVTEGNDRARARRQGVEETLRRHGLVCTSRRFVEKPYSHQDGRDGLSELLAHGEPPTAIVCGNDVLAMGVMFEARDRGLSIPGDLSVVGFDNLPITEHLSPALTTIDVPSAAIGTATAEAILHHLADGTPIASRVFPAPFLLRQTTAAPA